MNQTNKSEPATEGGHIVKYSANQVVGDQGTLKALMNSKSMQAAIADTAPRHLKPEKIIRMVLSAASRNPYILKCTQGSILKSAIEATMLGLDCSGLLGRGYMVPYRNNKINAYEAQFMPGYLGLCDLARRSGEVVNVWGTPVYKDDKFTYTEGLHRDIKHEPSLDGEKTKAALERMWSGTLRWTVKGQLHPEQRTIWRTRLWKQDLRYSLESFNLGQHTGGNTRDDRASKVPGWGDIW